MSDLDILLQHSWIERGNTCIIYPHRNFTDEDERKYVDTGVFTVYPDRELYEIPCPFGEDHLDEIALVECDNGKIVHFLSCRDNIDEKVLEPREYELMVFHHKVYEQVYGKRKNEAKAIADIMSIDDDRRIGDVKSSAVILAAEEINSKPLNMKRSIGRKHFNAQKDVPNGYRNYESFMKQIERCLESKNRRF